MARIALFGGSFDPPHLGHVLAACTARAKGAEAVWVLPSARHPYGKDLSPWDQRLTLCRAAFEPLGSWCEVREDEQDNPGGYTVDLVEALARRHPGNTWLLVGGTDTARDLHRWHRGADLARLVTVLAVPRRGYDDTHPAALPAISSSGLRADIAAGHSWRERVPDAVGDLIADHHWYGA